MTASADTGRPAPRIEHLLEGHYLLADGTREWKVHSWSDRPIPLPTYVDTTGRVGQPDQWRQGTRDLNELYSVQGFYRRRGGKGREWGDHTSRVDLATARAVYRWFHRLCQDPDWDSPTDARVINIGTGETVAMDGFVEPTKRPGDAMRTIPVTPAEWAETRRHHSSWDVFLRRAKRRDGTFVWKSGRDHIVGYEDAEGNVRIRPSAYKPVDENPDVDVAG